MLTRTQLDLLWNIEVACQRCIRASHCFDAASGTNSNLWAFTQNCYGGICVIHWCQVFGNRSEPTHYSHVFENGTVTTVSRDQASARLCGSVEMDEDAYQIFWQAAKDARDKFFVHNEFSSSDRPVFPDLGLLAKVSMEMRNIIREIITAEQSQDQKYQGDFEHFVSHYTNDKFLTEIKSELPLLEKAVLHR